MSLQSPLGRVLGLGSAKEGTGHWWAQRLTAVALVPLGLWFVVAMLGRPDLDYPTMRAWMGEPLNAILLILFTLSALYHSQLGVQVVVEDYVHEGWTKVITLVAIQFFHVVLGVASIYSIVAIAAGPAL